MRRTGGVRGWNGTRSRGEQAREGRCPGKETSGPRSGGRRPDTLQAGSRPRQEARIAIPGGGGGGRWPFSLLPPRGPRRRPRALAPGPCRGVRLHPGWSSWARRALSPGGRQTRARGARGLCGSRGGRAPRQPPSPTRAADRAHTGDPLSPPPAVWSGAEGTLARFLRRAFQLGHQAIGPNGFLGAGS